MKLIFFTLIALPFCLSCKKSKLELTNNEYQNILINHQNGERVKPGLSAAVYFAEQDTIWSGTVGHSDRSTALNEHMLLSIGSNTKLFTSVLILKEVEKNNISLSDSVNQYLNLSGNLDLTANIEQLLKHQTGYSNYTEHKDFNRSITKDRGKNGRQRKLLKHLDRNKILV